MNKTAMRAAVKSLKRFSKRAAFEIKKKAPGLLMFGGVATMVGGTVFACKATLKVADIVNDAADDMAYIDAIKNEGKVLSTGEIYTEELAANDKKTLKIQTIAKVAKCYAPAALLICLGIVGVCCGHKILSNRYTSMVVAYEGAKTAYMNARERAKEKFGDDVANEIFNPKTKKKVKAVDKDGNEYEKEIEVPELTGNFADGYHAVFCPETTRDFSDWNTMNAAFIIGQLSYLNRRLEEDGYLYLNDALEAFGLEKVPEGQVLGWIFDPNAEKFGENNHYIWLGPNIEDFVLDCENGHYDNVVESVWLEFIFNIDGNIVEKQLKNIDKDNSVMHSSTKYESNYLDFIVEKD